MNPVHQLAGHDPAPEKRRGEGDQEIWETRLEKSAAGKTRSVAETLPSRGQGQLLVGTQERQKARKLSSPRLTLTNPFREEGTFRAHVNAPRKEKRGENG